jgi:hypothetical protein
MTKKFILRSLIDNASIVDINPREVDLGGINVEKATILFGG